MTSLINSITKKHVRGWMRRVLCEPHMHLHSKILPTRKWRIYWFTCMNLFQDGWQLNSRQISWQKYLFIAMERQLHIPQNIIYWKIPHCICLCLSRIQEGCHCYRPTITTHVENSFLKRNTPLCLRSSTFHNATTCPRTSLSHTIHQNILKSL